MLFINNYCISVAKAGFSGKKIIALFLLLTTIIFSQDWNNTVQTTIPYSGFTGYSGKVDLFTNKAGNHILVQNGYPLNNLKYYLVNTAGTVLDSTTIESQAVEFAGIDGNNEKVYIVYKLGSYIKTKKSTDAGQNWSPLLDIGIGNNTCNNVDIIFSEDNALHVVWATQDNGNDYETYYYKLSSDDSWVNYKNVTDYSYEVGGFPTVTVSPDRVHVSYNTGQVYDPSMNTGNAKSRDKYDITWQTPQSVYEPQSLRERIHAGSSKLFDFFYKLEGDMSPYSSDLYVKSRDFGSTSWSSATLLKINADVFNIVSAKNSNDGKTHIVYSDFNNVYYRNYNGGVWTSEFTVGTHWVSPKIYSVSNDLFVV